MNVLGITIGDGAGVGPELVLTAGRALAEEGPVVAYGSVSVLRAALQTLKDIYPAHTCFERATELRRPSEAQTLPSHVLGVIACDGGVELPPLDPYPWGKAVPAFGTLQHASLVRAIEDAESGAVGALLTAPWHKARLRDAGLPATGHTEVLQARSAADSVVMLLAGDRLRVALATAHLPLRKVPDALTVDGLVRTGTIVDEGLRKQYGIRTPRIAFCGLNPHAGEDGVLGSEERTVIAPAIEKLREAGIDATGPYPADTLFPRVAAGAMHADAVVAMYHDQGLGPLKTFHFSAAANVTLGLPFVRTSVDHGTAYDIAGHGVVGAGSFLYAGRLAREMAERR